MLRAWGGDNFEVEHMEMAQWQKRGDLVTAIKIDGRFPTRHLING